MGILRTLPQEAAASAVSSSQERKSRAAWGQRQGLMLLGILLIFAGGIPAIYLKATFPPPPTPTQEVLKDWADVQFEKMTLTESWQYWKMAIEPEGLSHLPTQLEEAYERYAADLWQWIIIFCGVAIAGVLLLIAGFFMGGNKPRRV
jgi:hypothetical protein